MRLGPPPEGEGAVGLASPEMRRPCRRVVGLSAVRNRANFSRAFSAMVVVEKTHTSARLVWTELLCDFAVLAKFPPIWEPGRAIPESSPAAFAYEVESRLPDRQGTKGKQWIFFHHTHADVSAKSFFADGCECSCRGIRNASQIPEW